MNKQELINKWENETGAPAYEISDLPINSSKIEMYIAGYGVARKEILEDLKQLDEQQKPVVPKLVAEWIEKLRKQIVPYHFESGARFMMFIGRDFHHKKGLTLINEEIRQWLEKDGNEVILSNAIDYGYEVEKEPLYYVRLPYEVWDEEAAELKPEYLYLHYEITSDETRMFPTKEPRKGFVAKLDELTIKSADERFWPFAVPVEEVAEG
ncbi:TPA: DUF1642 domain-containing protein [Enterococcus faecium]|nr:DUF1642 domain-containing protein [Enterococcus faecium]